MADLDERAPEVSRSARETSDRWEWRRRIRADPHKRRVYRVVIAVLGGLLIVLGCLSGPLPGPGGIPLVLAGLAVLASEYVWARHLLDRAKRELHRFTAWARSRPRWQRWSGSALSAAVVLGGVWLGLVVLGLPAFLPAAAVDALSLVPGLHP